MKLLVTALLLLTVSSNIYSQTDYFLQTSLRSYPVGAAVSAEAGHGLKLYEVNNVLYGYVRAAANVQSSVVINYASVQVDIYPVSFFGLYAGKTIGQRSAKKLHGFDCDEVKCDNNLDKMYYGANLALAYKKIKFVNYYRKTNITPEDNTIYAEEYSNLIAIDKDILSTHTSLLGYDLNEKNMLGLLYLKNKIKNNDQSSQMTMLLLQHKVDKKSYQIAIGEFENRNNKSHFAGLFLFKWDFEKGLRLF